MGTGMLLDMAVEAFGERVALGSRRNGLSYADLGQVVAGGAGLIRAAGGRSMAFIGMSSQVFPALLFAAGRAGVSFTPVNYRLSPDQIHGLLTQLPDPMVVADEAYADVVRQAHVGVQLSREWLADAAAAAPAPAVECEDQPAVVLFTSGTTSAPKGVVLTHANLTSYVLQTVEFGGSAAEDAVLVSVPPYHIAGVGTVLSNVFSGRRIVYLADFNARGWLECVRAEAITNAMVVPTMLARIVDELAGETAEVPTLRNLAYGGARMPRPLLEAALRAFPAAGFVNAYGLTETSSTLAVLDPADHRRALASDRPEVAARLGSAGRLVPGVEGQIRDEAGVPLPPGQAGELWVRGAQVSGTYLHVPSVLDDGWFPTRDRGWFDTEGYLFIEGRSDDTIIRGGENIAPAEIEDVLFQHPAVREVAVLGIPDDEWGERICAAIVCAPLPPADTPGADEVRAWVRARLRGSRTPDDVVFVDEIPHSATGKVLRGQLRTQLSKGARTGGRAEAEADARPASR